MAEQPRDVAERIIDPTRGLARSVEFLSIAAISKWCDAQSAHVYAEIERSRRAVLQIEERLEWKDAPRPQSLIQKTAAWLNRTDPLAKQLTAQDEAKNERSAQALAECAARRKIEIYDEWGTQQTPTIAGIPVSRELVAKMRGTNG